MIVGQTGSQRNMRNIDLPASQAVSCKIKSSAARAGHGYRRGKTSLGKGITAWDGRKGRLTQKGTAKMPRKSDVSVKCLMKANKDI